jgi:voltage-gated potassium channel
MKMLKILQDISHHTLTRIIFGIFIFAFIGAILVSIFESGSNKQFMTIYDGVWWVLVTMTTVGYGDKVPMTTGGRMIGTIIMFSGVALLSLFTATVSSIFITRKLREGKGLQDIKFKEHLLICGWNFSAEQILMLLEKENKRVSPIVLINQLNEEAVADIIHRFPSLKIKFVRGDFSKEVVLNRANIKMAKAVIILPDSSSGLATKSDETTILSTLTIKSLNSKVRVIAYIQDRENLSHIRKAKADEVLLSDAYAGYLMASHILAPGVPQAVHQLFSDEETTHLTRQEIPASFIGKTYAELAEQIHAQNAIPIGVGRELEGMDIHNILSDDYSYLDEFIKRKFEQAGRGLREENRINIRINPPADTLLDKSDFLIVISQGDQKIS